MEINELIEVWCLMAGLEYELCGGGDDKNSGMVKQGIQQDGD